MLMLDLGSGLCGASQAMKQRGWQITTVDINPDFKPDVVADLREWSYTGPRPDLVWCSPPCDEFAREFMPWTKTGNIPDLSIVLACKRIIDECQPKFWVIENVMGSISWFKPIFGNYRVHYGPFYLWGFFPLPGDFKLRMKKKESYGSNQKAERAKIPHKLSSMVAQAIEKQPYLQSVVTPANKHLHRTAQPSVLLE